MTSKFYQGTNSLVYRSDLPFEIGIAGLLVRSNGDVFIGSRVSGSQLVAKATSATTYASWSDLTGSLNTSKPIKGLAST